jgi:PAS domain S-box-containing protein
MEPNKPQTGKADAVATHQQMAEAFALFNSHTEKLQAAHQALTERVALLDAQLEDKNRQLKAGNLYLNDILSSIHHGITALDLEGRVTTWNHAAEEITGFSVEELTGQVFVSVCDVDEDSPLRKALLAEGRVDSFEARIKGKRDKTVWVRGSTSPLFDAQRGRIGLTLFFSDLTQLYHLEEQARRSERLRALGELAAGVAHETRNPMTTIRGFIQLLPEEYDNPEYRKEFSENVIREIDRVVDLTQSLLDFAKPTSSERISTDMGKYLDDIIEFQQESFNKSATKVTWDNREEGLCACIDQDRLRQVFLNLFTNAIEAMGQGGVININMSQQERAICADGAVMKVIVIEVTDTGPGVNLEDPSTIFDPFFSTKHYGTGLGLAISHRIVEEHGGALEVENRPHAGALFRVVLPSPKGGVI